MGLMVAVMVAGGVVLGLGLALVLVVMIEVSLLAGPASSRRLAEEAPAGATAPIAASRTARA